MDPGVRQDDKRGAVRSASNVTHNTREFARITGLRLEDWEV